MKGYQQQFMMDLRVAINHPYVGHFGLTSHISKGPQYHIYEHMGQDVIDCCGKMQVLHQVMAAAKSRFFFSKSSPMITNMQVYFRNCTDLLINLGRFKEIFHQGTVESLEVGPTWRSSLSIQRSLSKLLSQQKLHLAISWVFFVKNY